MWTVTLKIVVWILNTNTKYGMYKELHQASVWRTCLHLTPSEVSSGPCSNEKPAKSKWGRSGTTFIGVQKNLYKSEFRIEIVQHEHYIVWEFKFSTMLCYYTNTAILIRSLA